MKSVRSPETNEGIWLMFLLYYRTYWKKRMVQYTYSNGLLITSGRCSKFRWCVIYNSLSIMRSVCQCGLWIGGFEEWTRGTWGYFNQRCDWCFTLPAPRSSGTKLGSAVLYCDLYPGEYQIAVRYAPSVAQDCGGTETSKPAAGCGACVSNIVLPAFI